MHVFANHGIRLAGIAHDTLLQSYVLEAHRNHDMDSLAERHLRRKTLTYVEVCGKGAKQLCFDQVDARARHRVRGRGRRGDARAASARCGRRSKRTPQLRHVYEDIELPIGAGAVPTWSAAAC